MSATTAKKFQYALVLQSGYVEAMSNDAVSLHEENFDLWNEQAIVVDAGKPITWPTELHVRDGRVALAA